VDKCVVPFRILIAVSLPQGLIVVQGLAEDSLQTAREADLEVTHVAGAISDILLTTQLLVCHTKKQKKGRGSLLSIPSSSNLSLHGVLV
jgi:hypothetical protein